MTYTPEKVALVAGAAAASEPIGPRRSPGRGYAVALGARDVDVLGHVAAGIEAEGGRAVVAASDRTTAKESHDHH